MEIGSSAGLEMSASAASGAIKDTLGAQLVGKTIDRLNTANTLSGPVVNPDYQFQKDVLQGAGLGTKLDAIV